MEIKLEKVGYTYNPKTPMEFEALHELNLTFSAHRLTAIIGKTGSGKSTLLKLLNGLALPTTGKIMVGNQAINRETKPKELNQIRKEVGVVFQFPENQLFAETILQDVMFGPLNFGKSEAEAQVLAEEWLTKVGIEKALFDQSPFELSGGQMRRVALAGVLACEPKILVLDEPSAGLDPKGNRTLMNLLKSLQKERKITIIMVTHSMENVAEFADQVVVMKAGSVVAQQTPKNWFASLGRDDLMELPEAAQFYLKLMKQQAVADLPITQAALFEKLTKQFQLKEEDGRE